MNKRGDWIQIFLILFFVLLLLVAIVLLSLERGKLLVVRPELEQDLLDARSATTLISLLRTPVTIDQTLGTASIADLIILDQEPETGKENGPYDQKIAEFTNLILSSSGTFYDLQIDFPFGDSLFIKNQDLDKTDIKGTATALLPGTGGNIKIKIVTARFQDINRSTNPNIKNWWLGTTGDSLGTTPKYTTRRLVNRDKEAFHKNTEVVDNQAATKESADCSNVDLTIDQVCNDPRTFEDCKKNVLDTFRRRGCRV